MNTFLDAPTPSDACYAFVRGWERLALTAYQDGGGVWTIGYGHTIGVHEGDRCAPADAEAFLEQDCALVAEQVERAFSAFDLSQQEFDGLVDFAFNCGGHAFYAHDMNAAIRSGDIGLVMEQMLRWEHDGGVVVEGLAKRRRAEVRIMQLGDYSGRP